LNFFSLGVTVEALRANIKLHNWSIWQISDNWIK